MLNLEATSSETDVEMALTLLLDAVRELIREFRPALVPQVRALALVVGIYDRLLLSQHRLDDASDALWARGLLPRRGNPSIDGACRHYHHRGGSADHHRDSHLCLAQ